MATAGTASRTPGTATANGGSPAARSADAAQDAAAAGSRAGRGGLHVVTLDLLVHGRSHRPADPLVSSTSSFAVQVEALLDHLDARRPSSADCRSARTCRWSPA